MRRLMYSAAITYEDYLAAGDECDLEAYLIKYLSEDDQDDLTRAEIREHKAALRKIDSLKVSGEYPRFCAETRKALTEESQRAMDRVEQQNPGVRAYLDHMEQYFERFGGRIDRELRNLFDGKRSPDHKQAERFNAMYDAMGLATKTYAEIEELLPALERVQKPKGRRKLPTPWSNEIEHMDAMRLMVGRGVSIIDAARERANAEGRPMADANERARTLAKLYRQRVALRNK